jgi:protein-L-isoaspartate(D-aspartate) O-methyltransferase
MDEDGRDPQDELHRAALDIGVTSQRVLDTVRLVPRSWFVPDEETDAAGADQPIPIGHGQTTSQPSLVAKILEDLRIAPGSAVLEIGTGLGYEAALATVLAAPGGNVVTIERDGRLAAQAHERLQRLGELLPGIPWDVQVRVGDGALGAPEFGPFDAIIVAATCDEVPGALFEQLADGGRLIAPVGHRDTTRLLRYERDGDDIVEAADLGWVRYVPLVAGVTGEGPSVGPISRNTLQAGADIRA